MGWVKLEDRYARHPKLLAAGEAALALDVCGMCYAREHGTGGFIPDYAITILGPVRNPKRTAGVLVEVHRWDRDDELGGWWVHDYPEYNPDDDAEAAAAEARREKARKAARTRWNGHAPSSAQAMHEHVLNRCSDDAHENAQAMPPSPPLPTNPPNPPPEPDGTVPDLRLVPQAAPVDEVQSVFDAWVESTGRTGRTKLDAKRRKWIRGALDLGYDLDELVDAVRGWRWSRFHRGENDRQKVYNGLNVLLRDAEQIEMFREYERRNKGREVPGPDAADFAAGRY